MRTILYLLYNCIFYFYKAMGNKTDFFNLNGKHVELKLLATCDHLKGKHLKGKKIGQIVMIKN